MGAIATAVQLLGLWNAASPGIADLLLIIRRKDGTVSIGVVLDEGSAQFKENLAQATEWVKSNPKP